MHMLSEQLRSNASTILEEAPCRIVLPAGCGKTQLVATSAAVAEERGQRLLVLTHTHAGVDALRRRMKNFGLTAATTKRVSTIDSWVKHLVYAFPQLAGYGHSGGEVNWRSIREAALRLLGKNHIAYFVKNSYDYVVIDEYQDCDLLQHEITMAIARILPIAVLGDPLQSILTFNEDGLVNWETDLVDLPIVQFDAYPWRWHGKNESLGRFLSDTRSRIEHGQPIDLQATQAAIWLKDTYDNRRKVCWNALNRDSTVVVLHRFPQQLTQTAKPLKGHFGIMEELEGKRLLVLAQTIDHGNGLEIAASLVNYARDCFSNMPQGLKGKADVMSSGSFPSYRSDGQLYGVLSALEVVAQGDVRPATVRTAFRALGQLDGTLVRKEAWRGMSEALQRWEEGSSPAAIDAVHAVQDRARVVGRRHEQRTVSRVVLVKGQQFDECIVLEADELNSCELYVAMTRPSQRLTILSKSPALRPKPPAHLSLIAA